MVKLRKKSVPAKHLEQPTGDPRRNASTSAASVCSGTSTRSYSIPDPNRPDHFKTLRELWGEERRARQSRQAGNIAPTINEQTGEKVYAESVFSQTSTLIGHARPADSTDFLHSLVEHGAFDSITDVVDTARRLGETDLLENIIDPRLIEQRERMIESLLPDLWKHIAFFLHPGDRASLALASKTLLIKLGFEGLPELNKPENRPFKTAFLILFDRDYPLHLLCPNCATYHLRMLPGRESYRADFVSNPLVLCPRVDRSVLPRTRIAHDRELPFRFVQLATRAHKYSASYGINYLNLGRQWKTPDSKWSHRTRFHIHKNHLLLRVVSQSIAQPKLTPTGERMLLYGREEYEPYFSVCAHWRDGLLMKLCKCALSHIPERKMGVREQALKEKRGPTAWNLKQRDPDYIVRGCGECNPMRRCPECPSEYLIEIKMVEDRDDPDLKARFKHAITVTRWTDLGDGSSPVTSKEWRAIHQLRGLSGEVEKYDSFAEVGARALCGIFESEVSNAIPGQRILNLNPSGAQKGEEGDSWY